MDKISNLYSQIYSEAQAACLPLNILLLLPTPRLNHGLDCAVRTGAWILKTTLYLAGDKQRRSTPQMAWTMFCDELKAFTLTNSTRHLSTSKRSLTYNRTTHLIPNYEHDCGSKHCAGKIELYWLNAFERKQTTQSLFFVHSQTSLSYIIRNCSSVSVRSLELTTQTT